MKFLLCILLTSKLYGPPADELSAIKRRLLNLACPTWRQLLTPTCSTVNREADEIAQYVADHADLLPALKQFVKKNPAFKGKCCYKYAFPVIPPMIIMASVPLAAVAYHIPGLWGLYAVDMAGGAYAAFVAAQLSYYRDTVRDLRRLIERQAIDISMVLENI